MDGLDETADPPYLVPTHLGEGQSIGPIPVRTFYVVLASALLLGAPLATLGRRELGDVGLWLGLRSDRPNSRVCSIASTAGFQLTISSAWSAMT